MDGWKGICHGELLRFHEKTSREHPEVSQIILWKIKVVCSHVLDL